VKDLAPATGAFSFGAKYREGGFMLANTDLADVNEIYVGYLLAGEKWWDPEAKAQFNRKYKGIGAVRTAIQIERAERMVEEFLQWAKKHKYSGTVKRVWWTARPGVLARAVGREVDSRKNPTDILIQFSSGPTEGFLGLSAKSTSGSGDIGFKNPGVGTVEAALKIDLGTVLTEAVNTAVRKFRLPENSKARKDAIRKSPKVQAQTQEMGSVVLHKVRDIMYRKLDSMSQAALRDYILSNWLDASNDLYPPYVKVTGMGDKPGKITAKVDDPLQNEKLSAIMSKPIALEKVGNESIGVSAGGKKILKMRAKFESEKLASTIKFSGDPWS
jgi:hypothetical protein